MSKQHAKYNFSSSYRWVEDACPVSVRMSEGYDNPSTPDDELGTAKHALGEFILRMGVSASECLGMEFNGHVVDLAMIEDISVYTSYILSRSIIYDERPIIENTVKMKSLGRDDCYGTPDSYFIAYEHRKLEVMDYKGGFDFVDAVGNTQTAACAVAIIDTYGLEDLIDTVETTVVQPNFYHAHGPARSVTYSMAEMLEWREKFRRSIILAEDKDSRPKAGKHCKHCLAQANCRTRMNHVLDNAYIEVPMNDISIPELEQLYLSISSVKVFQEKVKDRMLALALKGTKFDDLKVVHKQGRAVCEDEKVFVEESIEAGHDEGSLYNTKLKSKTDLTRIVGKKVISQHFIRPLPSKLLTSRHDGRPAIHLEDDFSAFNDYTVKDTNS